MFSGRLAKEKRITTLGCAAHGPTQESALAKSKDAIALWIETAKEHGDPVPQPVPRGFSLEIPSG